MSIGLYLASDKVVERGELPRRGCAAVVHCGQRMTPLPSDSHRCLFLGEGRGCGRPQLQILIGLH